LQSRAEFGLIWATDSRGRTIWIADAHRDDGKRLVVRADEKLTAFLELESAIRARSELSWQAGRMFSKLNVANLAEMTLTTGVTEDQNKKRKLKRENNIYED
jgi:hypothetical protein